MPGVGVSWRDDDPKHLPDLVDRRAGRLAAGLGSGGRVVIGVAVERRDGMTWGAARCRTAARDRLDDRWRIRCLSASEERMDTPLRELSQLVGSVGTVRRAARTSRLVPELKQEWGWWSLATVIVAACSAGGSIVGSLAPGLGAGATMGAVMAVAVIGLVGRLTEAQVAPLFGPLASAKIEAALAAGVADTAAEREFRETLRRELVAQPAARLVIIDDLSRLSPRTRELVAAYLAQPGPASREELWVLFERGRRPSSGSAPREPLNATHLQQLLPGGNFEYVRCRQRTLTIEQKERLIQRLEQRPLDRHDLRRRYRGIGDITGPRRDERETLEELHEQLVDQDSATVHAFALLALAAAVPAPAALAPEDLAGVLRGQRKEDDALRRVLMRCLPEEARRPAALHSAVRRVWAELQPMLEERTARGERRRVQVMFPYADAMETEYATARKRYGLPDADDAHAFWALYWHRMLAMPAGWSAVVAERLVIHLRKIRDPAALRTRHGGQVARQLGEAALAAVDGALAFCVNGIFREPEDDEGEADRLRGPGVLDQAHLLVAGERGGPDRRLGVRALESAWVAYMLTGDPMAVATIATLADEWPCAPASDALEELYVETVPRAAGDVPRLALGEGRTAVAIADHASARAAWFACVLKPMLDAEPGVAPWLSGIADSAGPAIRDVVDRTEERLEHRQGETVEALDWATLTLIALRRSLINRRRGLKPMRQLWIKRMVPCADARREERNGPGASLHFLLDGVLRQFDATARGDANALDLIHVMWHNLELHDLADLAALGGRVADRSARGDEVEWLVGLVRRDSRPVNVIASEMLTGIERGRHNTATASVPLLEAGSLAIDAGLGARLVRELSKLLVNLNQGDVDRTMRERLVLRALEVPAAEPGFLDVPDSEVYARVPPDINRFIYEHLADYDPANTHYHRARAHEWRVEDERLQEERLVLHVADRRCFEVFWHHFERQTELPCDLPREVVTSPLTSFSEQIPPPLLFDGAGRPTGLSGEFLRLGHAVFHTDPSAVELGEARAVINRQACRHINPLYRLLEANAPSATMRTLFERQRRRFDEL